MLSHAFETEWLQTGVAAAGLFSLCLGLFGRYHCWCEPFGTAEQHQQIFDIFERKEVES